MWIDIHNAFGSVNRELLFKILASFGLLYEYNFVRVVKSLYIDYFQLYDDGYFIRAIPELVGVKQGDPLSALMFSFYLAPAMFEVAKLYKGFKVANQYELGIAAYADDILLFAPSVPDMVTQLDSLVSALKDLGLEINLQNSALLSLNYRCCEPMQ